MNLAAMTAAGDPRAESLWYRTGDNSLSTADGRPGFVGLNDHLRNGFRDPEMAARVADIDSVMRESVLEAPILVHRGIDSYHFGEPGSLTGVEFRDKAFVSTSTDPQWAAEFGTVMRIHVPAGTSAVRMADRPGDDAESEILLDRGLKYRVTGETLQHDQFGRIADHVIDVEVVPGGP